MTQIEKTETQSAHVEGDRDLVASRVFDAPRELVFDTWLDAEHVSNWWGPRGFTTTTTKMDARPGGEWLFVMHGPDGRDYRNRVRYLEIVRPERLVYFHDGGDGEADENGVAFEVTVTFAEEDGGTRIHMRMRFNTAEMCSNAARFGAIEGLDDTLGRLAEQLAALCE